MSDNRASSPTESKRKQQNPACGAAPEFDSTEKEEISEQISDSPSKRTKVVILGASNGDDNDTVLENTDGQQKSSKDNREGEEKAMPCGELHRIRCNECDMCRLEDCGNCASCVFNQTSTTTQRRACLLRVCETIEPRRKAQPLADFLYVPFRVFFSRARPTFKQCHSGRCFCKRRAELGGISLGIVLPGEEPQLCCLRQAMSSVGYSEDQVHAYVPKMWEAITGTEMKVDMRNHELVRKGYYHTWTDCQGGTRSVCGQIINCRKSLDTENLSFQVELVAPSVPALADCGAGRQIPAMFTVLEKTAWGGYIAFREKVAKVGPLRNPPLHYKWITPDTRHVSKKDGVIDCIHLTVGGCHLELRTHQSLIPGAGFGLFLTCHWSSHVKKSSWVLPVGSFVDLGVYGPHLEEDLKSSAVWNVKNLLFSSASECWGFDASLPGILARHMFDISDDVTGTVHPVAARSIIVYANETESQTEVPSLYVMHDPSGAVHYLLGHPNHKTGALELPLGEEIELKVWYGSKYERERVRQGYSRVNGSELQDYLTTCAEDEEAFSEEICTYTVDELLECIEYLERVRQDHPSPERLRDQFLLLLVSISLRTRSVLQEFRGLDLNDSGLCLEGYDECLQTVTVPRLMKLVQWNCFELWKDEGSFNSSLSQRPLLQEKLSMFLDQDLSRNLLLQAVADMMESSCN